MELRPENQIPFPRPEGYDADRYELCARWLHAMDDDPTIVAHGRRVLRKFDFVTTSKTDTNNWGAVSTDFIGGNYDWPGADYARREQIFQEHVAYQMGYHHFMANDTRVPQRVREAYSRWGLPRDEFVQSGHWPHQLYIREGRRMVADYVITEHDCMGRTSVTDPIALGAYNMDSHNVQRVVVDRRVRNEGDVQVRLPGPYGISWRAIVPRAGECTNLLVPVALSASHIAFGSVRMEPVFMMLAESAAVAAALSLDRSIAVGDVPYNSLAEALAGRGQVLESSARNTAGGNPDDAILPGEPLDPRVGA
jgi:hypothetical protein